MAVRNWTLGTDPVWVANYRVTCPGVHVKSHDGYIRLAFRGACLDWLSDKQAAHLLGLGLVERIPADEQPAIDVAAPVDVDIDADEDEYAPAPEQSGAVDECLATLAPAPGRPSTGAHRPVKWVTITPDWAALTSLRRSIKRPPAPDGDPNSQRGRHAHHHQRTPCRPPNGRRLVDHRGHLRGDRPRRCFRAVGARDRDHGVVDLKRS
jgi:hypothetical protein